MFPLNENNRKSRLRLVSISSWETISVNHNSALIFVELTSEGFLWGSRVQWQTAGVADSDTKKKIERVIYYVDPIGFLEVINSNTHKQ